MININFDINAWQKQREKRKLFKFQNSCPHVYIQQDRNEFLISSSFEGLPGMWWAYRCRQCGAETDSKESIQDNTLYWSNNVDLLHKKIKSFKRKIRKMGVKYI